MILYFVILQQRLLTLSGLIYLIAGVLLFTLSAWKPAVYLIYSFIFALLIFYYQPYISWGNPENFWVLTCGDENENLLRLQFDRLSADYPLAGDSLQVRVQGYRSSPLLFFLPPFKEEPLGILNEGPPTQELFPRPVSKKLPLGIQPYQRDLDPLPCIPYYRYYLYPDKSGRYQISERQP